MELKWEESPMEKQPQKPKKARISPERRNRFKWDNGDLKIFKDKNELEQQAKSQGEKITWYK